MRLKRGDLVQRVMPAYAGRDPFAIPPSIVGIVVSITDRNDMFAYGYGVRVLTSRGHHDGWWPEEEWELLDATG